MLTVWLAFRNQAQLEDITCKLRDYASLFTSDEQFDPYDCLSDLYDIQEKIQNIWKSPYGTNNNSNTKSSNFTEKSVNVRYSADDFDNLSSEDEYDYEDDDDTRYSNNSNNSNNDKLRKSNNGRQLPSQPQNKTQQGNKKR